MTQTKHTPGPWVTNFDIAKGNRSFGIVSDHPSLDEESISLPHYHPLVASVNRGFGYAPREIAEANARLIATVPDLLSAAQLNAMLPATTEKDQLLLEQFAEDCGWKKDIPVEQFAKSYNRAAITKAIGGQ